MLREIHKDIIVGIITCSFVAVVFISLGIFISFIYENSVRYPSDCKHKIITEYGCVRRCGCAWIPTFNRCIVNDDYIDQFTPYGPILAPECDVSIIYIIRNILVAIDSVVACCIIIASTILIYDHYSANIIYG